MRKLKRLWLIGLGLLLLVVWLWPFIYIQYALSPHEDYSVPFIVFIINGAYTAFGALRFLFFWWNYVGYAGLALIFTGLYRLVRPLFEEDEDDNPA